MPDSQPEALTAFLMSADYHIRHAGEIPEDAGESLRSTATHYAPRLHAAVEKVLALAAKHEHGATRWEDPLPVPSWIPELREAITRELLSKGE